MKTLLSLSLVPLLVSLSASAQPAYLNYQGRLTDTAGQPLTGMKTLTFIIYPNALGGTPVWGPFLCDGGSGAGHTAQAYLNSDGRFNVILGDQDTDGRSITVAFTNSVERYVEISVNGGPPIQPRQQFLSAPYALQSAMAQRALVANLATNLTQALLDDLCPPGTIVAYGGSIPPRGWLWCDGSVVASNTYPRLYSAISTNWGDGRENRDGIPITWLPCTFNLPDLRGMFLRGVNLDRMGTWADPDLITRTASRAGGNAGNKVGSVQTNEFKSHIHADSTTYFGAAAKHLDAGDDFGNAYGWTGSTGGNETRPNNVYVLYIIKY